MSDHDQTRSALERLYGPGPGTFWRVEGSLLNLSAVRPVAFFTWNAQSFLERWVRRWLMGLLAMGRPVLYASNRVFATRALHAVLRGVSRDRLDLLGEEYFNYRLKPRLKQRGVEKLKECLALDPPVILVSQGLEHLMRPLARYLGVDRLIANRLEFRGGIATGRLIKPVIRPRGGVARLTSFNPDGRIPAELLLRKLGLAGGVAELEAAIVPAERIPELRRTPAVVFDSRPRLGPISVRRSLAGRNVLLIGGTGFIGKVFLAKLLTDVPDIGKIYMLIRSRGNATALERFEKMVECSPVFDPLQKRHGNGLEKFIGDRVEVVDGNVTKPNLGLEPAVAERLARTLDLVVNDSGLTDFNPDVRTALSTNVDGPLQTLEFVRRSDHAGLMHLSTCFVVGSRDGRIHERLQPEYTPGHAPGFDAEREYQALQRLAARIEERAATVSESELLERLSARPKNGNGNGHEPPGPRRLQKARLLWTRGKLIEAGLQRARELGWPNTYTFTKSLAESLIIRRGSGLPVAVVRPSIVETSTEDPFRGWNEGVNTSAPLSFLLGTYFRQLPSNERKCLDLIPVDLAVRGMLLISAAIVERRHAKVYQLATSDRSPCDMGRSIELTCLAHRKHYMAQDDLEHWMRARFDTIPVSKARYERLSAPRQKVLIRAVLNALPGSQKALAKKERLLEKVERLIELYEPFILHNEQVFEAENIELLARSLPDEEQAAFGYDAAIDWWDYWINIHVPALRKWSYPLILGRPLETPVVRTFRMPETSARASQ